MNEQFKAFYLKKIEYWEQVQKQASHDGDWEAWNRAEKELEAYRKELGTG